MNENHEKLRREMVSRHLESRGIKDPATLAAMGRVPREEFVPPHLKRRAYEDTPLSIGQGQTISQPYMVALMTERLGVGEGDRVLEIGTGSGYQTAALAELGVRVFSVERVPELADQARLILAKLGYDAVTIVVGDGTLGLREHAPYDGIIVTAGAPAVPSALTDQLQMNSRLVIPVGRERRLQRLLVVTRTPDGLDIQEDIHCVFVPLIGEEGWSGDDRVLT